MNEREDRTEPPVTVRRLSDAAKLTDDHITGAVAQTKALKLIGPNTPLDVLKFMGMDKAQDAVRGAEDEKPQK